jgi:superfamily II DNA/RNA helicase
MKIQIQTLWENSNPLGAIVPLFRHIKDQRPLEQMEGPMAIVMTPTRELAVQIHRECKPFLKVLNLRVRSPSNDVFSFILTLNYYRLFVPMAGLP